MSVSRMNQNTLYAKIGISAIAWLNEDMPELTAHISVQQALDDMRKIGFKGTENGSAFPKQASALEELLSRYDLRLVSGWHGGKLGQQGLQEEIFAMREQMTLFKKLKADVIVYGETGGDFDLSQPLKNKPIITNIKAYAKKLNDLAKFCQDFGVPLVLHHHMGTMIESMLELDQILSLAPEVNIVFDTGHCLMAGGDPIKTCRDYAQRIRHLHLKDIRDEVLRSIDFQQQSFKDAFLQGVFTVPGDGCIDYDPILETLKCQKYQGWFMIEAEQDPHKADPYTYSKMGFQYTYNLLRHHDYRVVASCNA